MEQSLIRRTINAGAQIGRLGGFDAAGVKDTVTDAFDDGYRAARKMVKRGRHAAVDMLEDMSRGVKRAPLRSVAMSFGLALGVGLLLGFTLTRGKKR